MFKSLVNIDCSQRDTSFIARKLQFGYTMISERYATDSIFVQLHIGMT